MYQYKINLDLDKSEIDHVYFALINYRNIANRNSVKLINKILKEIDDKIEFEEAFGE